MFVNVQCCFSLFVPFIRRPLHFFGKSFPFLLIFLCVIRTSVLSFSIRSLIFIAALQETNEELQAQMLTRSLEEGRNLLGVSNGNSLAAELEAMSAQEVSAFLFLSSQLLLLLANPCGEGNKHNLPLICTACKI